MMSNPVVIVTGVSRGIGYSIAQHLLKASATVIGISRTEKPLKELAADNSNFHYVSGDLTDEKVQNDAVKLAIDKFNRLDGLILNAGVLEPVTRLAEANVSDWKKLYDVNFFSIVSMLSTAIPHLRNHGKVIFVSSGASTTNYIAWGAYGSSKAALDHLAGTLAAEEPIFSVAVAPGVVDTQMQTNIREQHKEQMTEDNHKKFTELKATGKLLTPEVPAAVIGNLALKGKGDNLNGKSFRYNSEDLSDYIN